MQGGRGEFRRTAKGMFRRELNVVGCRRLKCLAPPFFGGRQERETCEASAGNRQFKKGRAGNPEERIILLHDVGFLYTINVGFL